MYPFSTRLKISQNRKVFWCFQAVEKGCIGNKWEAKFKNDLFSKMYFKGYGLQSYLAL